MTVYTDSAAAIEERETLQSDEARVIDIDFSRIGEACGDDKATRTIPKKPLYYRFIKRLFDIVFSIAVIVVAFVPMLILSIFVAFDTKAFPIYTQERIGRKGPFKFYKLRSMVADSDDVEKYFSPEQLEQWRKERKVDNDPRIDLRMIETNTRRPLSALVFASVFPPKNTVVSTMFPQANVQIFHSAELAGKFFAQAGRKTAQFSQKLAKRIFALLGGLNNRVRIPSAAAGFIQPASA